ncbi:sensor histidine kinase, partial [Streptomyces sp. wa1002]
VACTTTGTPRTLPQDTGATVYRIVQEALTNVVKHARADRVDVELTYGELELTITVRDDGQGPGTTQGLGLIGIRERAAAHGGTVRAGGGPGGRGFELVVGLPLTPGAEGVRT